MHHAFPDEDPTGFIGLRYFPPPEHLRSHFGTAYLFTVRHPSYADTTRADAAQLRFLMAGGGQYRFHDGREAATPEICLLGPTMGATHFALDRPSSVLGLSILPLGWLALVGGDASEATDQIRDMAAIPGYADLMARFRTMADPQEATALLWTFVEDRMRPVPAATERFIAATDAWLADESSPRVDALVESTGLSARQVARLANRLYGGPPKLLARKYRALRCAARIGIDHENWQTLCEDGTFYDQSHFIREIRHFIGLSPHQLMSEPTPVALLTLQRRDMGRHVSEINRIS